MKNIFFIFCFLFLSNLFTQNMWTQKANFSGTARYLAVSFSIGNKGYVGTGYDGTYKNDFWEYDPSSDTWTQKANLPGTSRAGAVGFSIGFKGYIGSGYQYSPPSWSNGQFFVGF